MCRSGLLHVHVCECVCACVRVRGVSTVSSFSSVHGRTWLDMAARRVAARDSISTVTSTPHAIGVMSTSGAYHTQGASQPPSLPTSPTDSSHTGSQSAPVRIGPEPLPYAIGPGAPGPTSSPPVGERGLAKRSN